MTTTQDLISKECQELEEMLLVKNRRYGDSAVNPRRLFSKADPLEQIAVRIDDKLSRIDNMGGLSKVLAATAEDGEDTVRDLLGYLILARVAVEVHKETALDKATNTGEPKP